MFENFMASDEDAIIILKNDHDTVKGLFERFEDTDNLREKKKIAANAIIELKIHAEIEEKIFYPALRREVDSDIMNEANEEHHVAKLLIAELDRMDGTEEHWEAKFMVLAENIRHHIKEEEGEMFPKARALFLDFETIGRRMLQLKEVLKQDGVPPCDEEKLMATARILLDSPAKTAEKKTSTARKMGARKARTTSRTRKTRTTKKKSA